MERRDTRVFRIPGLPGRYKIPGVYISPTEPAEPDAVLWVNPYGNKSSDGLPEYTSVYGAVSSVLNDMYVDTAKKYNTIGDAIAGSNESTSGTVLAYTLGGVPNIVLTADISSSDIITVTTDCTIHLNGHKLSFATGTHFYLTSGKLTINGTVPGSEIAKEIEKGTSEYLVSIDGVEGTELRLFGGAYSVNNAEAATGPVMIIRAGSGKVAKMTLSGCSMNMNCSGVAVYAIQSSDDITIDNCTFDMRVNSCDDKYGTHVLNAYNANAIVTVRNSTMTVNVNDVKRIDALVLMQPESVVENCTISVSATKTETGCRGVYVAYELASTIINNCRIAVNGDNSSGAYAVSTIRNSEVRINGGYYRGDSKAFNLNGPTYINGDLVTNADYGDIEYCFAAETATDAATLYVKDENGFWIAVC